MAVSHPRLPAIKVMTDYHCAPLWTQPPEEPDCLDPKGLVSTELADALMKWQRSTTPR